MVLKTMTERQEINCRSTMKQLYFSRSQYLILIVEIVHLMILNAVKRE